MKKQIIFRLLGIILASSFMTHCSACGNNKPDINKPKQESTQAYLDHLQETEELIVNRINLKYGSTLAQTKALEGWVAQLKKSSITTLEDRINTWRELEKKLKSLEEGKKAIQQKHEEALEKLNKELQAVEQKRQSIEPQKAEIENWNKASADLAKQSQELIADMSTLHSLGTEVLRKASSLELVQALTDPNLRDARLNLERVLNNRLILSHSITLIRRDHMSLFPTIKSSVRENLREDLLAKISELETLLKVDLNSLTDSLSKMLSHLKTLEPSLQQAISEQVADFQTKKSELEQASVSLKVQELSLAQEKVKLNTAYQHAKVAELGELTTINQNIKNQLGIDISLKNFDQLSAFCEDLTKLYEIIRKQVEAKK